MSDVAYDPFGSRAAGLSYGQRLSQMGTDRRAGRQLAGGDYTAAATTLFNSGDLAGGQGVQQAQAANETAARARQTQDQERQLQFAVNAARGLKQVRQEGGNVLEAYTALAPALMQMGQSEQDIAQLGQQIAQNPDILDQIEQLSGQQLRELSFQKTGDNLLVFEEGNPDPVRQFAAPAKPIEVGGVLVDPETYQPILDTREPKYQTVQNSDGSSSVVAIDQPAPIRGAGSGSSDINSILDGVIQREGGFVARDGRSGAPANFGINQRANPDIDVANLTEDGARRIYQERYINPIVRAGVTGPALEAVIDFGVNAGVGRSLQFWEQSGGDINRFNELRLRHYRSLPDYAQNGRSWERRVAETTPGEAGTQVSPAGGIRVVAQGANNGPTPAGARAEAAAARSEARSDRTAQSALRREFNNRQDVKEFREIDNSYRTIQNFVQRPSAAGDISLIFAFMKVLDPTSTVREGEFATASNAGGVPDSIRNLANRAMNGQRLQPNQRRDFLTQAGAIRQSREQRYNEVLGEYRFEAEEQGFDPSRIIGGRGQAQQPAQPRTNAPGLRFNITPEQLQTRQSIVGQGQRGQGRLGSAQNPYYLNPSDARGSYANLPSGAQYVSPDGQIRTKR